MSNGDVDNPTDEEGNAIRTYANSRVDPSFDYEVLAVYMRSQGIQRFSEWQFNFLFRPDEANGLFGRIIVVKKDGDPGPELFNEIARRSEVRGVDGILLKPMIRAAQAEVYTKGVDARDMYGLGLEKHTYEVINDDNGNPLYLYSVLRYSLNDDQQLFGRILQLPPGAGKTLISTWLIILRLLHQPKQRIIFALPLRALAVQVTQDTKKIIEDINGYTTASYGFLFNFKIQVLEGPGSKANPKTANVFIATYEHAASIIRRAEFKIGVQYTVGTVIIDEVHEIMKDRGLIVDDILYFSQLHRLGSTSPLVNVMSGTLPSWVVRRIKTAYKDILDNETISITDAQSTTTTIVPVNIPTGIEGRAQCITMVRDIVNNLLDQRIKRARTNDDSIPENKLVCFMNTVADAEAMFLSLAPLAEKARQYALMEPHASPAIALSIDDKSFEDSGLYVTSVSKLNNAVRWLEAAGIYLHHAGIRGSKQVVEIDGQKQTLEPKDIIIQQITTSPGLGKFTAVFSTSTLSTGLNLARAQIAFLGPNTMWSVDQAQQMIGRVGRKGAGSSVAYVTVSNKYLAPGAMQISFPDSWFIPRLTAALSFAGKLSNNANIYDRENRTFIPPFVDYQGGNAYLYGMGNIDIRGFYSLLKGAPIGTDDVPGNGLLQTAISWNLIDENGIPTLEAKSALDLSGNDPLSLPVTSTLLSGTINYETVIAWQILMNWTTANGFNIKDLWTNISPNIIPKHEMSEETRSTITKMCSVYGSTHQKFPSDNSVPSAYTAAQFVSYVESYIDGCLYGAMEWKVILNPKGDPKQRASQRTKEASALIDASFAIASSMVAQDDDKTMVTAIGEAISMREGQLSPAEKKARAEAVMNTVFGVVYPVSLLKEDPAEAQQWHMDIARKLGFEADGWFRSFEEYLDEAVGMDGETIDFVRGQTGSSGFLNDLNEDNYDQSYETYLSDLSGY